MTDTATKTPPPAATPDYRAARRWNLVWVVPIIALLLGAWMIWRNLHSQGPVAYIRFETADGIGAGKTEVRCRSVRVGMVKNVILADDSVVVMVELAPEYDKLLREGTAFWVVRPRASAAAGFSGLETLITGAYLEINPGPQENETVNHFDGLERPPATSRDIPGLRIVLSAEEAGSVAEGSAIYFRGIEVGRIENRKLDVERQRVTFDAFIRAEYSVLVRENTRFWNTSGINVSAGIDGLKLKTPSFQAMLSGGATFGIPEGVEPGKTVADGTTFTLFSDQDEAEDSTFNPTMKFVLLFDQSVRGLRKGAPVEFRGIPIGRVADISFEYLQSNDDSRIPVLVEIDPSLLRRQAAEQMGKPDAEFLKDAVARGLRASLKPGSLITGAKFVDVDYYKEVAPAPLAKVGEYLSIPTVPGGLEDKITAFLDKMQALPIDDLVAKVEGTADAATETLKEFKETSTALRKTLDSEEFAKIPAELNANLAAIKKLSATLDKAAASYGPDGTLQGDLRLTLDELHATLRSLTSLTNSIDDQPNSLLFGRDSSGNTVPKAPKKGH